VDTLPAGIIRVTHPLPHRPRHVHCYLVPGDDGWTVVDTGLGLPDARERWAQELEGLGPVARIFVTHYHPDHVGAAADLRALTGAPVLEGALDREQCVRVWGPEWRPAALVAWFARAGVPTDVTRELVEQGSWWRPFIRYAEDALPVEPGEDVAGWTALPAAGHADGQIILHRDGIVLGGDHLLDPITPAIGLWPESRPDPLADYLAALDDLAALAPEVVLPGHGEPILRPAERARAIALHHEERLDETAAALRERPLTGFEVSLLLFPGATEPGARRFAVAETLSHLERLVAEGRAHAAEAVGVVTYTSF
jgi:glyoxylase-like metal-dependent hydrolase (beta-lactamase superfamily II)